MSAAQAEPNSGFAWVQHPGAWLPAAAVLSDEAGHQVMLGSLMGGVPVVLDIGYFHCPSLCGVVRSDLYNALQKSGLASGRDYDVISVSIDPAETPADAAAAKRADLAQAPFVRAADVHYLTGPASSLAAITGAVGFHARYDARFKQFLHPAGLVVLTRAGQISTYMLGVGYTGGDVRAAILRAGSGGIAAEALPILLLCFHFDSATGRYTLEIMKVLRLAAALTVLTIAGLLIVLHRKSN